MSSEIKIHPEVAREVIEMAINAVNEQRGLFENGVFRPESNFIDLVRWYSETEKDPKYPANALFFATTLVFGSRTEVLFDNLADRENFIKFFWIFDPKEVVSRSEEEVIYALEQYPKRLGYQGNAFPAWRHNSQILVDRYEGDIRNFFLENENCANEIFEQLVVRPGAKGKLGFRRFGPKLAALLIQWINQYEIYQLDNVEHVGMPVDFHLGRIALQTGMVTAGDSVDAVDADLLLSALSQMFIQLCEENKWTGAQVSEALWSIGVLGCNRKNHAGCPISHKCGFLISRKEYDNRGVFSLSDSKDWREGR